MEGRRIEAQDYRMNTSLGPCILMGGVSWLALFSLYQWFN